MAYKEIEFETLESRRMLDASAELVADLELAAPADMFEDQPRLRSAWFQDALYFAADDGLGDVELWKSDGTSTGTVRVADIGQGASSFPLNLSPTDGKLFFRAYRADVGRELWVTDGTEAGTRLVSDIVTGPNSSIEGGYNSGRRLATGVADKLFFYPTSKAYQDQKLWVSDGTDAGTHVVLDRSAEAFSYPRNLLTVSDTQVAFTASVTSEFGASTQLVVTDGSPSGTMQLGEPHDRIVIVAASGGRITYWSRDDGDASISYWSADLTTMTVAQIPPIEQSRFALELGDEVIFYRNIRDSPRDNWRTVFTRWDSDSQIEVFAELDGWAHWAEAVGDDIYVLLEQSINGGVDTETRLWKFSPGSVPALVDGVPQFRIKGGTATSVSSVYIASVDNTLWRAHAGGIHQVNTSGLKVEYVSEVFDSDTGKTLAWVGNSTTHLLLSIDEASNEAEVITDSLFRPSRTPFASFDFANHLILNLGDKLAVGNVDYLQNGFASVLSILDSSSDGPLRQITPPLRRGHNNISYAPIIAGGKLFVLAGDEQSPATLWVSDGVDEAQTLATPNGNQFQNVSNLTAAGEEIFFVADTDELRNGLWKSDGTHAGTKLISDDLEVVRAEWLRPSRWGRDGVRERVFANHVYLNGFLYFVANGPEGLELWRTDGEMSAEPVADLPGMPVLIPGQNQLFLVFVSAVWVTNGSADGTQPVGDLPNTAELGTAIAVNNHLLLISDQGVLSTDGQSVLAIYDSLDVTIHEGRVHEYFTTVGEFSYFVVEDGDGEQLWRTDGTPENTKMFFSLGNTHTHNYIPAGELLYFSRQDEFGYELWQSDGTTDGTTRVDDVSPGEPGSVPSSPTQIDDHLYFIADDGFHGREVFRVRLPELESVAGDADRDGEVSFSDFLILSENFGKEVDAVWEEGDFDADGKVSFSDFLILSANFGKSEP